MATGQKAYQSAVDDARATEQDDSELMEVDEMSVAQSGGSKRVCLPRKWADRWGWKATMTVTVSVDQDNERFVLELEGNGDE
jgi:hypothetical protein